MSLSDLTSRIDGIVSSLRREFDVPGCAVGVLTPDGIADTADGVLNTRTGAPATTDSLFQVGSVTKLWTATLVLQAAEEGLLDLDAPVTAVLPGFRTADAEAGAVITPRDLLTHTSGLFGDAFGPSSRGDDAVERFVDEVVPTLLQDLPPRTGFSYSNSGYAVLGRIVEVVRGKAFPALVADHIATPLGLEHWAVTPERALLYGTAVGHVDGADGPQPAPLWNLPASMAPAGALLCLSPRALLAFAGDVVGPGSLLGGDALREALTPHVAVPDIDVLAPHWGLGWMLFDWPEDRVIGHDGGTLGQSSLLRVLPERGIAVVSLANGGRSIGFHRAVAAAVLDEVGVRTPALATPPPTPAPIDAARCGGRFETSFQALEIAVAADGSSATATTTLKVDLGMGDPAPLELVALDGERLISTEPGPAGVHAIVAFVGGGPAEPATHVFSGGRLLPRVG